MESKTYTPAYIQDIEANAERDLLQWLSEVLLKIGYSYGKDNQDEWSMYGLRYKIKTSWSYHREYLSVNIRPIPGKEVPNWFMYNDFTLRILYLDYNEIPANRKIITEIVQGLNAILSNILPLVPLESTYVYCESGFHSALEKPEICSRYNDIWVCDECLSKHTEGVEHIESPETIKKENKERKKMTKTLRYQVLERDRFTCQSCGRGPKSDPNIRLHVDHITPIVRGGMTILANLRTLCQDCNLGKSDRLPQRTGGNSNLQ